MKTTTVKNKAKGISPEEEGGTKLSLDEDSYEFLQDVFIRLYSNTWKAILREYTSNALDAQIAARVTTQPAEVILPEDSVDGKLIIRDYGTGMDENELRNIYSKIGASTKRKTNKQVGGFGFGGKSALSEVSEFFITSIKHGTKVEAVVRKKEGSGAIYITSSEPTDEGNGTTITIPAPWKFGELHDYVQSGFFVGYSNSDLVVRFANGHTVNRETIYDNHYTMGELVPGEPVAWLRHYDASLLKVQYPAVDLTPKVLVGGVVYPIDNHQLSTATRELYQKLSLNRKLYINVPVGSVKLTPSREALQYNDQTKETLAAVFENVFAVFRSMLEQEYDRIETPHNALTQFNKDSAHDAKVVTGKDNKTPLQWKGLNLPTSMPWNPVGWHRIGRDFSGLKKTNFTYSYSKNPDITLKEFLNAGVIITGVTPQDLPKIERGMKEFIPTISVHSSNEEGHVLAVEKLPRSPWLNGKKTITYAEFTETVKECRRQVRLANAQRREADPYFKPKNSYWVFCKEGEIISPERLTVDEILELDMPIRYVARHGNPLADKLLVNVASPQARVNSHLPLSQVLPHLYKNEVIIFVEASRSLARFEKDFPDAVSVFPTLTEDATRLAESLNLSRTDLKAKIDVLDASGWNTRSLLNAWTNLAKRVVENERLDEINDPELLELLKALANRSQNNANEVEAAKRLFNQAARLAEPARIQALRSVHTTGEGVLEPFSRYWLLKLTDLNSLVKQPENLDHILAYISSVNNVRMTH